MKATPIAAVTLSSLAPRVPDTDLPSQPVLNSHLVKGAAVPEIQSLTRAVRYGDAEAFSRLYDLYGFRIYKFLLVLARGNEEEAREACQAVFIKVSKRCHVFEDEPRFWAWLCVLAKNSFFDHCRARKRWNRFLPLDESSGEAKNELNPEHRLAELLDEALAELLVEERELLEAAYVDKRPLLELANQSGQTYKAVESRLARLRQKLKERLLKSLRHENEF
jgi:RNA polymerase sigma-70 factor, ECF subfamily